MKHETIRLILGDQLSLQHSWFGSVDQDVIYLMMEVPSEYADIPRHAQQVLGVLGAMRKMGHLLKEKSHSVLYLDLSSQDNQGSFEENLQYAVKLTDARFLEVQNPDDHRLHRLFKDWKNNPSQLGLEAVCLVPSEHFLADPEDLRVLTKNGNLPKMETFYRKMRVKTGYLMEGGQPLGGRWNYDEENRKRLPKDLDIPPIHLLSNDLSALWEELLREGLELYGNPKASDFPWPIDREQSLMVLERFLEMKLEGFGPYQDAMSFQSDFLFHSLISFSLNTKMLNPKEVLEKTISHYSTWDPSRQKKALPSVEGFLRQILGWREYMRAAYDFLGEPWLSCNFLEASLDLPDFYWTSKTKMNCLKRAISGSLENSYAHHIHRLMVTGNFALLLGVHPDSVDHWYRGMYIDAFDWVERTNTRGMSQYADGGQFATKPYISGGRYIQKMSDYCSHCFYDPSQTTGERACPFSTLFWDFVHRHERLVQKNPRTSMMVRTWVRFSQEKKDAILQRAQKIKSNPDSF